MSLAFVDRPPTPNEIELLRLILSTYQDGTGQQVNKAKPILTLPGWRDFERTIALVFNGIGGEDKKIFDVLIADPSVPNVKYGLSCKMRGELDAVRRKSRVTIELSNSAKKFWQALKVQGIYEANYKDRALEVGTVLIELVKDWHNAESIESSGRIDLTKSSYLVLSWNKKGEYQIHQFSLELPLPQKLNWYFPIKLKNGVERQLSHLNGDDVTGTLFEWYAESGGQLKYYPLVQDAIWASEVFELEPLPDAEYGILAKAKAYFPETFARIAEQIKSNQIIS